MFFEFHADLLQRQINQRGLESSGSGIKILYDVACWQRTSLIGLRAFLFSLFITTTHYYCRCSKNDAGKYDTDGNVR